MSRVHAVPNDWRWLRAPFAPHLALLVCSTAVLCFLCTHPVRAEDTRLSYDQLLPTLPASALIQSVAAIGDTALVAWGSTYVDSAGRLHNCLEIQRVVGTTPIDSAVRITDDASWPWHYVQVVAYGDHFIVAWSDSLGGARLRTVETSGEPGPLQVLDVEGTFGFPGLSRLDHGALRFLVWSDTSSSVIKARGYDGATRTLGALNVLGSGAFVDALFPSLQPELVLIDRGNDAPLLMDTSGRIERLGDSASWKFRRTFFIDRDGSVVVTEGSTVLVYATVRDSVPERTLTLPSAATRFPGAAVAMRDSGGTLVAWYPRIEVSTPGAEPWTPFTVFHQRIREYGRDTLRLPDIAHVDTTEWYYSLRASGFRIQSAGAHVKRGCGGRLRMAFSFRALWRDDYQGQVTNHDWLITVFCIFDSEGRISGDSTIASCHFAGSPTVKRLTPSAASDVVVRVAGSDVRLSAPCALVEVNVPDERPAFGLEGDTVHFAWLERGPLSYAVAGRWRDASRRAISTEGRLPATDLVNANPNGRYAFHQRKELQAWSRCLSFTWYVRWNETGSNIDSQWARVYMPIGGGWKKVFDERISNKYVLQSVLSGAYDQDSAAPRLLIGYVGSDFLVPSFELRLRSDLSVAWRGDSLPFGQTASAPSLLALRGGETALGIGNTILRLHGDSLLSQWGVPGPPPGTRPRDNPRYLLQAPDRIVRFYTSSPFTGDVYDLDGDSISTHESFELPPGNWSAFVTSDPTTGNVVYVACNRERSPTGGVFVTIVDSVGRIRCRHRRVSMTTDSVAAAVGLLHDDTLYVAWVDFRRGTADIYGTTVALNTIAEAETAPTRGLGEAIQVIPNPASDAVTVVADTGISSVRVFDVFGRLVARQAAARSPSTLTVDLRSLTAGTYIVEVATVSGRSVAQLVMVE